VRYPLGSERANRVLVSHLCRQVFPPNAVRAAEPIAQRHGGGGSRKKSHGSLLRHAE